MRLRRAAGVAAAATTAAIAALGFGAGPALAAGPSITITSPGNTGPLAAGPIHVAGQVTQSGGTVDANSVSVVVASLDGHPGGQNTPNNPSTGSYPYAFDFAPAYNGSYRITVTAAGTEGMLDSRPHETSSVTKDVQVEIKPVAPANLVAAKTRSRTVALTWNRNPEPDLLGYQVQRSTGGDWFALANTIDPSYTDESTASAGGTYSYRVYAIRQGATAGTGVVSDPSAVKSVDVPAPPATTTTTAPDGSGTSGGSSGGTTNNNGYSSSGSASGGSGGSGSQPAVIPVGGGASVAATPELARTGQVDLSGFSALLQQAQQNGPAGPATTKPTLPDGTYEESLPFKKGDGEDEPALGVGVHEDGFGGTVTGHAPIAFTAASLLVTVVLMHVLWLKREVERVPLIPAEVVE